MSADLEPTVLFPVPPDSPAQPKVPPHMKIFLPCIDKNRVAKTKGRDVFKHPTPFVNGVTDPVLFLKHLRRVIESKVMSANIVSDIEVYSFLLEWLDPMSCDAFLTSYSADWLTSSCIYSSFLIDFGKQFLRSYTGNDCWEKFESMLSTESGRFANVAECHAWLVELRSVWSSLPVKYRNDCTDVIKLKRRIPQEVLAPHIMKTSEVFVEWLDLIEESLLSHMKQFSETTRTVPVAPHVAVNPPVSEAPVPMDVDSLVAAVVAKLDVNTAKGKGGGFGNKKGGKGGSSPAKGSANTKGGKIVRCFSCGGFGHMQNECPSPSSDRQ
jgi:hypothetical protein